MNIPSVVGPRVPVAGSHDRALGTVVSTAAFQAETTGKDRHDESASHHIRDGLNLTVHM